MEMDNRHPLRFKIVRTNPENMRYEFTNDIVVTYDRENFYLQFGQISPPHITGQEDLENVTLLGSIESPAVSRLVVDKAYIPILIHALQENLAKHNSVHQKSQKTDTQNLEKKSEE